MKISLIQIDLVMGARVLLSLLKKLGYDAKALQINIRYMDVLGDEDLSAIYDYVSDSDAVGISFNTFYALIAEQLAVYLKKRGIKYIIAGGNHATALPDEVIAYSDIVIKYEAEITLPSVLDALQNKKKLSDIKGIVYKEGSRVVYSKEAPEIVWDLDALPFQSVDTTCIKYYDLKRKLYEPEQDFLFPHRKGAYFILASRGCPFSCTYCSNSLYHRIDKRFKTVRKRSVENILLEMEYALSNGYESFYVADDHFFSFTLEEIEYLSREYKERIRRPFSVAGINPNSLRSSAAEKKLKLLLNCGLTDIRIGVQSGSNKTLEFFNRGYKAEDVPGLLALVDKYRKTIWGPPHDSLHVALDIICDAVWECDKDRAATIRLAQKMLGQYSIFFYTLVYLPGTEIYSQAVKEGWVEDKVNKIYLKGIAGVEDNIYNRLLFLIAVAKERGVTFSDAFIEMLLGMCQIDVENVRVTISSMINCINGIETYHKVNLKHAALHPYLTGFNEWVKQTGEVGKKVLFRSYHEPYG